MTRKTVTTNQHGMCSPNKWQWLWSHPSGILLPYIGNPRLGDNFFQNHHLGLQMWKEGIPSGRTYRQPDLSFWSLVAAKSSRLGVPQQEGIYPSCMRPQTDLAPTASLFIERILKVGRCKKPQKKQRKSSQPSRSNQNSLYHRPSIRLSNAAAGH